MGHNGFDRCDYEGMIFYRCSALGPLADVRHGFSTRFCASCSRNPAREARPLGGEDHRRFLDALGLAGVPLVTLTQVHSDKVRIIPDGAEPLLHAGEGDALATRRIGVALGVQVADCFPILLADPVTGAISAIHSGWRGTAAQILAKTVKEIKYAFAADPASLFVVIGPGIRSCCMQVGPEVAARYEDAYPGMALAVPEPGPENKYLLDMPRALRAQCAEAGVRSERIFDLGACTRCRSDEFFSYRAEGTAAGRMLAVIGRLPRK